MILSDHSLKIRLATQAEHLRIVVTPLADGAVQPSSIDVRLGHSLLVRERGTVVNPKRGTGPSWHNAPRDYADSDGWLLLPGELYLGSTLEWIEVPDDLLCLLHGRSSLARDGVTVHQQAGLIDPGYRGNPTAEITVTHATVLYPGQVIGQLTFQRMTTPAERPYGTAELRSRYQGDSSPQPAKPPKRVSYAKES